MRGVRYLPPFADWGKGSLRHSGWCALVPLSASYKLRGKQGASNFESGAPAGSQLTGGAAQSVRPGKSLLSRQKRSSASAPHVTPRCGAGPRPPPPGKGPLREPGITALGPESLASPEGEDAKANLTPGIPRSSSWTETQHPPAQRTPGYRLPYLEGAITAQT